MLKFEIDKKKKKHRAKKDIIKKWKIILKNKTI
jgi:hypothetical protein